MDVLRDCGEVNGFDGLLCKFKSRIAQSIERTIKSYNSAEEHILLYSQGQESKYFEEINEQNKPVDRKGCSPMAPLPFISPLYHGSLENALDIAFEPYPVKEKGIFFGTATEAINSLAAIKKVVYEEKRFSLSEIYSACLSNYEGEKGALIKSVLWNCPKWGNNDDYVDEIATDVLEFCLKEAQKYKTFLGGQVLGGIHQPHPVLTGKELMATPEGRCAGAPVAVTLTPESGTAKNGPTAILHSAAKIDPMLVQWNYCVMVNYFASVFKGNNGKEIFKALLTGYFKEGGLQHQPNVLDVEDLKRARLEPEKYKDLIVRLWGVSAHFVDLPKELQDEMISRFS
jgi:formate C-acetyltransferase